MQKETQGAILLRTKRLWQEVKFPYHLANLTGFAGTPLCASEPKTRPARFVYLSIKAQFRYV